jgi:hypothetical protein
MRFVLPFLPVVVFILVLVLINQIFPYLPPGLRFTVIVFFLIGGFIARWPRRW